VRALVTGAAGFIGSRLCHRLIADGHDVVGLDDLSFGRPEALAGLGELRLVEADVRDGAAVADAARGCDVLFHQAALKSVPRSIEEPERYVEVNVRGTINVLDAARAQGAAVVNASSSSVYGDQERYPVTEEDAPRPLSPYAATKLAAEGFCRAWWTSFGVPTVSLRYLNVYGPGQDPASEYASVIPRFVTACLDGGTPEIFGDGEQRRDFTFIDDVVEANVLAARMPERARGAVLNVGGGRPSTSVNELLAIVTRLTDARPEPVHRPPRAGDIRRSEADVSLARSVLGYDPGVDVPEGLARTVAWFRDPSATRT
jgi:nucleoside-diphosphate-sugar epimerase